MYSFFVTNNRNRDVERVLAFEGQTQVVKFELGAWEQVNGYVTSVTWTLKSGSAGISGEVDPLYQSFSSAVSFIGRAIIAISGIFNDELTAGTKLVVSGSADNDGTYTVESWTTTQITVEETFTTTVGDSCSLFYGDRAASALITTSQSGRSMIKVSLTAGSNTEVLHFEVFAKDPQVVTEDYGFEYR